MAAEWNPVASRRARSSAAGRRWIAVALGVAGAVLLFLGWYGVSGQATIGEQLPYLASGSIPGAALVISAAVLLGGEHSLRASERTEALIAELHALLVEVDPPSGPTPARPPAGVPPERDETLAASTDPGMVALPAGEHYHRATCALVAAKADAERVDAATIASRRLQPCPVCEPDE